MLSASMPYLAGEISDQHELPSTPSREFWLEATSLYSII
jgi:hypothetical protein